eukprot:1571510-Rhodomonas_salina.3
MSTGTQASGSPHLLPAPTSSRSRSTDQAPAAAASRAPAFPPPPPPPPVLGLGMGLGCGARRHELRLRSSEQYRSKAVTSRSPQGLRTAFVAAVASPLLPPTPACPPSAAGIAGLVSARGGEQGARDEEGGPRAALLHLRRKVHGGGPVLEPVV